MRTLIEGKGWKKNTGNQMRGAWLCIDSFDPCNCSRTNGEWRSGTTIELPTISVWARMPLRPFFLANPQNTDKMCLMKFGNDPYIVNI